MKELHNMLRLLSLKHKMTEEEKDALLSELIASYTSKKPCYLMKFLMKDDFEGFQNHVKYMTEKGLSIKECIQSNLESI